LRVDGGVRTGRRRAVLIIVIAIVVIAIVVIA
jgi:hypothetical protein